MRRLAQAISLLAIVGTILPSVLFLSDRISLEQSNWLMLLATLVWFAVTPLWMGRETKPADPQGIDPI